MKAQGEVACPLHDAAAPVAVHDVKLDEAAGVAVIDTAVLYAIDPAEVPPYEPAPLPVEAGMVRV